MFSGRKIILNVSSEMKKNYSGSGNISALILVQVMDEENPDVRIVL